MTELEKEKKLKSYKWGLGLYKKPKDAARLIYELIFNKQWTYYLDKDTLKVVQQQNSGASRSKEDIFRIMNTYNKKISYRTVGTILNELVSRNILSKNHCYTVRKDVYSPKVLFTSSIIIENLLKDKNIKF